MKYRDIMSEEELEKFRREVDELDAAYAAAAAHDALNTQPVPQEWEDEMETLTRAALSRGQP